MGSRDVTDVVVVGSGPNGLAAAVTMARAGHQVVLYEAEPTLGGGARTLDLDLAGHLRHDVCSAVHPLAVASPFFTEFDLPGRGVEFTVPEVSYAQPLDDEPAAVAYRDLDRTAWDLGADGPAWRSLYAPLVKHLDVALGLSLGDMRSMPAAMRPVSGLSVARRGLDGDGASRIGPRRGMSGGRSPLQGLIGAARFGLRIAEQGTRAGRHRFAGRRAPALFTGVAAHGIAPMPALAPAGMGLLLGLLGHTSGWAIPVGGSQVITDALVADLRAHGGTIHTSAPVADYRELPRARAYFFDTTPQAIGRIWGRRLPAPVARRLARYRYGNGVAKVDFVLSEPVPWRDEQVGRAATVHVGGTREDMMLAEEQVAAGRHAGRPMVLAAEPAAADPGRLRGGLRPLWTYAHVPGGSTADVTEAVTAQLERFAPGFRDVVVDSRCVPAARMSEVNANYVGGDIGVGRVSLPRMITGPTGGLNPYSVGIPGVYLSSAATPPAPGVHGMCGHHAARWALRERFGTTVVPSLAP